MSNNVVQFPSVKRASVRELIDEVDMLERSGLVRSIMILFQDEDGVMSLYTANLDYGAMAFGALIIQKEALRHEED